MRKLGRIFVISAASGSGKTTLCRRLLAACKNLTASKSLTTRPRRKGERDKRDYIFVSKEEFLRRRKEGALLEWAKVFGNYYGTPAGLVQKRLESGKNVMLVIDVQGAFKARKKQPDAVLIFILPPSMKELERRLLTRKSDDLKQIRLRLKVARKEIAQAKKYDYRVINDEINGAVKQLKAIIERETETEKS